MKKLTRMLLRDIKRSAGQFIAIIAVVAMGVTMYTGINSTFKNLEKTRDEYYENYNFEHLEVMGYGLPISVEEKVSAIQGVKMAAGRIILSARLQAGSDYPGLNVLSLPGSGENAVNDVYVIEGKRLQNGSMDECMVEETFADGNGLKVGDVIVPNINGKKVSLKIAGICRSPEYVYVLGSAQDFLPDPKKFGVIYISKSLSQSLYGMPEMINDIAVVLNPGASEKNVKLKIESIVKEYEGTRVIARKDQLSDSMLQEEIKGLKSMGILIPVVFFAVASIIIFIMLGRTIENKRIYIGILKSLGYKNNQILGCYMAYPIFVGTAGSILGIVLGYFLGMLFTGLENQYFGFPSLHSGFYMDLILPVTLLTYVFCLLSSYIACRSIFKISPSESMKPPAPRKGRRILLERVPLIWRSLKFSQKMRQRSISRNMRRNVLSGIGIVLSTVLLIIGFSVSNSLSCIVSQIYDVQQKYDVKVTFKDIAGTQELEKVRSVTGIDYVEPVFEGSAEIRNGEKKKDISITASRNESSMYNVVDEKGNVQDLPDEGILIPKRLVETLGAKVGGYIDIKPYFPDAETKRVKVSGIASQYLGLNAYMDMDNMSSVLGKGGIYTGAFIRLNASGSKDIQKIKEQLYSMSMVDSVDYRDDVKSNMEKNLMPFKLFSMGAIILAAVMSIAVIYNITVINIYEKKRELASLKVMGFTKKEVRSSIYGENRIVGAVSIILGLPIGRILSKYIIGYFYTTDAFAFPVATYGTSYIFSSILILAFILSAEVLLRRKIDRIDMVDVLKVRE
jgi:ABC-type transport system, involved in lipoprotein release, permease component